MTNKQINRYLREFKRTRQAWIDALVANPNHSEAAHMVLMVNSKIELLRGMWNWSDETEEME